MKILLITSLYPSYPGQSIIESSYAVHYFAREWAKEHEVKVMRLVPIYPLYLKRIKTERNIQDFILEGVNIWKIPIRKIPKIPYSNKSILSSLKLIKNKINDNDIPDFIICDILNPSIFIGEELAKQYNAKLIGSLHNTDVFFLSKEKNYSKFLSVAKNIDKIVYRSKVIENKLHTLIPKNISTETIAFGINETDIINNIVLEKKAGNEIKNFLIVSSLKKGKNIDTVIKAFQRINHNGVYNLTIVGDGPEMEYLKRLTVEIGIEKSVFFRGLLPRDEVLNYMLNSEVFVLVSSPETFGLVYIEAMSKGCITIGSKGEGIDGVIDNKINGYLCEPGKVKDLALILDEILTLNQHSRKTIIEKSVNTAKELTYENLSKDYMRFLSLNK